MRRAAALPAAVLMGALLVPSSAIASDGPRTHDGRWIAVEDHFAVVLPTGETLTEDAPGMAEDEEFAPPVGARLFISEVLYATSDGKTRGAAVGRTYIECSTQALPDALRCDAAFVFGNGSQLIGSVLIDFAAEPAEQLHATVAVLGGTGDHAGASGELTLRDVSDEVPGEETVTVYETHLR